MVYLENDAVISDCGKYRYLLRRIWDRAKPRALIVMLNPSTADAVVDDPTIRSCVRLCQPFFGGFEVINLYAFRSTDPEGLLESDDPIGPDNWKVAKAAAIRSDLIICAWGAHEAAKTPSSTMFSVLLSQRPAVFCFDTTKHGMPKHPLYIKSGSSLKVWEP